MKQNRHCFTLVEILMVTGMICMIAALIVVAYNGVYRSWSTGNTVATMKAAHLALDKYMLENNSFPWTDGNGELKFATEGDDQSINKLAKNLLQECAPYSHENGNAVTVFDDFGKKEPIRYIFPHKNNKTYALMSKGKDGDWGGEDDIIYLPRGDSTQGLNPGFYMCTTDAEGKLPTNTEDIEPIAQ